MKTNKIKVKPEGREDVWLIEKEEAIKLIRKFPAKEIHNFIATRNLPIGCNWKKSSVIKTIKQAESIGILTGMKRRNNLNHSLSVIKDNKLYMFNIGEITTDDLDV